MNRTNSRNVDATTGNLWKLIFVYAIPLILGTLIQTCFNSVDLMVVGNMADSNALASVGATTSIVHLMVGSLTGIAGGSKIILAHNFGAKNSAQIKATVDTSMITALFLGLLIAVIALPFAPSLLNVTNCPADCFDGAVLYIRIYVSAAPFILIYNFGAAVLTATGDSRRPLYFIIISGLTNVLLNIILCLVLTDKVAAVAIATAASQIVAAVLVMYRLCTMEGDGHLSLRDARFRMHAFLQIMSQGLPLALNSALYPFANLQIQSAINTYGVSAIAGNSASATLEGIPSAFSTAFASTATVFMSQNLGANLKDRVRKSFRYCLTISCSIGLVTGIFMFLTGRFWLSFFLPNDPAGIEFGMIRMQFVTLFYVIACANGILSASIQSFGHAPFSAVTSIIGVCGFRMFWMHVIYPLFPNYHMLMACFLVSWSLVLFISILGFLHFRKHIKKVAR